MTGVARGLVEVVENNDDGATQLAAKCLEQFEEPVLVGNVEECRRLVKQENWGLLSKGHRDPDALTLPSGQLFNEPAGNADCAGRFERSDNGFFVFDGSPVEHALVGVAPAGDEISHADPVRGDAGLRQQAEPSGKLFRRTTVNILSIEQDRALEGR